MAKFSAYVRLFVHLSVEIEADDLADAEAAWESMSLDDVVYTDAGGGISVNHHGARLGFSGNSDADWETSEITAEGEA